MKKKFDISYDAKTDPQFQKPYIDIDEWRERGEEFRYVHGGFEGTDLRFSFFFPKKEKYQGRFYQFMPPVQGSENAAFERSGLNDWLKFSLSHGGYFIESNMGVANPFVPIPDPTIIYRSSAAAAEYSRILAIEMYGDHHPYGYIYGGSGGGYKTLSCVENTNTWDGAVPFVIGTPTSIPNNFTIRAHAKRVLRNKLPLIADSIEPGGDKDIYSKLNKEEGEALKEITRFGFPMEVWFMYETMDDGALPVLRPLVDAVDSQYYEDFWTLPGYLGSDPNSSAVKDRIQFKTKVKRVHIPDKDKDKRYDSGMSGVDEAWKRLTQQNELKGKILIELEEVPKGNPYFYETQLELLTGEGKGFVVPLEKLEGNTVVVGEGFGIENMSETLSKVKEMDEVLLDNSNYIALQTYHRHQVPALGVGPVEWDQYRDEEGNPIYPQRKAAFGEQFTIGGCGSVQSGRFNCKMIVPISLMDESAFPSQADWYHQKVKDENEGQIEDKFRIWFTDKALHGDEEESKYKLHTVPYLGTLCRALVDVSKWVEEDIAPAKSSAYRVEDGAVIIPKDADDRKGVQPVVDLTVSGKKRVEVKVGEAVEFIAKVKVPEGTGKLEKLEWNFEGEDEFLELNPFVKVERNDEIATAVETHQFLKAGTYFPVVRVSSNRHRQKADIFQEIKHLDRMRVIVK